MDKDLKSISGVEFVRLANNFYNQAGIEYKYEKLAVDSQLVNYVSSHKVQKSFKVAFVWVCLNPNYWQFAKDMIDGARQFFLPGHKTDYFLWTDIPKTIENEQEIGDAISDCLKMKYVNQVFPQEQVNAIIAGINTDTQITLSSIKAIQQMEDVTIYPTESVPWPFPTLMRYNLFLQQEEKLKEYDYIFYCDVDMRFVNVVGDEILGEGLTVAPHPGYATRKETWPPYEPNPESASYIKRPGRLTMMEGKPRFVPFYAAGGFQGGKSEVFIRAMKKLREIIDLDLAKNYVPIWNDETAWNKYIFDIQTPEELNQTIFLTPSYIYPDSLIKEYYEPLIWGRSYEPRLMTLTKKFSTSAEGGLALQKMLKQ